MTTASSSTSTDLRAGGVVVRPRLEACLDDLLLEPPRGGLGLTPDTPAASVALVCAPAGFGKSTLVSTWARRVAAEQTAQVAWCSMRGATPGPFRFWTVLLEALAQSLGDEVGHALVSSAVPDRAGDEPFLLDLLDALPQDPVVLVLDDVDRLHDGGVLRDLDRLVERRPSSLRLVLVTRADPALPALHDLRLSDRLTQVRAGDLAFDLGEVAQVAPDLTEEQHHVLWSRTEGWPALVRLARLALEEGAGDYDLVRDDGALADHIFAETYRRQRPDVQRVLLTCAVPSLVPDDLAVLLSGDHDAPAVLELTARRSGLISRTRCRRGERAFRFHPILRAYLQGELGRSDPAAQRRAREVTARYLLDQDEGLDALRHAVRARDEALVEEVVARAGEGLVADGHAAALLSVLPPGAGLDEGWAGTVRAAALLDVGAVDEVAARWPAPPAPHSAEDRSRPRTDLDAARSAVRAHLRRRTGTPDPGPPDVPPPGCDPDVAMTLRLHTGVERHWCGDLTGAEDHLQEAARLASGLGRDAVLLEALTMLAAVASSRSDFTGMRHRLDEGFSVLARRGWAGSSRAAFLHVLAGWGALQSLEPVDARRLAERGRTLLGGTDDPSVALCAVALHAATSWSVGLTPTVQADELHGVWTAIAGRQVVPAGVAYAAVADAHLSLVASRGDRLREIIDVLLDRVGPGAEVTLVGAMRELVRANRPRARELLTSVVDGEQPALVPLTALEALVLRARVDLEDDRRERAVLDLRRALAMAADLGALGPLLDSGGAAVTTLMREERGRWGRHEPLVERLLARAAAPRGPSTPLTPRELDVLHELPSMRTVEEIAGSLFVSVNTVKTHLGSVYRKFGVTSRREAVAEARRVGLV